MGKKKKIVSLIVSVAMLVAMFPMIVHADETETGSFTELQALIDQQVMPQLDKDYEWKEGDSSLTCKKAIGFGGIRLAGHTIDAKGNGSVILVEAGETFEIVGNGTITGGVAVDGAGIKVEQGGILHLYGGALVSNTATGNGGGIYNEGTVIIQDCTISSNSADKGSAIYNVGTLQLAGDAMVVGNTGDDIYLCAGTKINVTGSSTGAYIGVNTELVPSADEPVVFTSGLGTYASKTNFFSNTGYKIELASNELQLESSEQPVSVVKLTGCSVSLDGSINLIVYADLSSLSAEQQASARMSFNVPGRGAKVVEDVEATYTTTEGSKTYQGFACSLSAVQMAEEVSVSLTYDGCTEPLTGKYSVKQYLETYQWAPGDNPLGPDFIPAVCNFGHFLQPWLSSVKGWAIGDSGYAEMPNVKGKVYTDSNVTEALNGTTAVSKSDMSVTNVAKVSVSLEFDTTNSVLVFFTLKEGTEEKLTATCEYNGKTYKAGKLDDGRYRIRISNISALDLDTELTISGECGGEFSVTLSALSYVHAALAKHVANAPLTAKENAMLSIYYYWYFAEQYARYQ
ncbi:MAG: hypothetical protein IK109_05245 [Clostridiales bacterium]|nr:hypothetical protein [Clostridiales bacterium]